MRIPESVRRFISEAERRIEEWMIAQGPSSRFGFVPSDFVAVYHSLRVITEANLAPGTSLCEWGSGFGVVASLAAMLEFKASGIEVERGLVDASRRLADDFGLPVEFVHGSFVPSGAEAYVQEAYADTSTEYFWLVTDADDAYDELGLDPHDFDVVFAYPWPGEEHVIENLFAHYAAEGALLLTYNQFHSVRIRRKVGERSGGS